MACVARTSHQIEVLNVRATGFDNYRKLRTYLFLGETFKDKDKWNTSTKVIFSLFELNFMKMQYD